MIISFNAEKGPGNKNGGLGKGLGNALASICNRVAKVGRSVF